MMESTALDSWSPYHVSCPWSIQGLLQSQYINATALVLQLLKQKSPCCFYLCPHQQAVQEQCNISTMPASRQTGLLPKLPFIKVSVIKLDSCLGISPYCLLLPGRTQTQEGTPTETASITSPMEQAGAQLHFGPKSNLWCFTWNADSAVHWIWSLLKFCRSSFCLEEPSARWGSSKHCWRHKAPALSRGCSEATWKCSRDWRGGNTLSQVFWRRGNKPFKAHKCMSAYSQTAWCRDVWKPGQPSSSLRCPMMLGNMMRVWEEVWAPK